MFTEQIVIITKTLFSVLVLISATLSYFNSLFSPATTKQGFPGGSDSKESNSNAEDPGSITGLGKSPEEGNGNPLQCSCLENSMDREAWMARVHGLQRVRHDWVTNTLYTILPNKGLLLETIMFVDLRKTAVFGGWGDCARSSLLCMSFFCVAVWGATL